MSAAFSRIVKFVNPSFFSRWAIATPAKPAPMLTIDGSYARQAVAKLLLMRQRRLTSRCGGRGGVGVGALPVRTLSPDFRGFKEASRSMNRVSGFGKNPEHSQIGRASCRERVARAAGAGALAARMVRHRAHERAE